jgi:hypothetical protein
MKLMLAEFFRFSNGRPVPEFYCSRVDATVDQGVTETLFALIQEQPVDISEKLQALVAEAEAGRYTPKNPDLPDWSINNKDVWLTPPMAKPGHIAISNEYTEDFSVWEGGEAQQFTYAQFRAALKHWREFLALVEKEGKENWVGRRYEAEFPE